jgi:hypothetical protein
LANTGVTATTYGTTTAVPTIAVDSKGRITSASNTNIAFPVLTVNSQSGNVVLTTSNIAEGTNQYFTTGKVAAYLTGAISTVLTTDLTASRALVSDSSGKIAASGSTTATEIGYLAGVTSAIQTQINTKAADNAVVHIAGTETITGAKTFSGGLASNALTLTGALSGTSATFSGIGTFGSSAGAGLRVYGSSGTNQWDIYLNSTNLRFSDNTGTGSVVFDRPLSGTSATFSSTLTTGGKITANGGGLLLDLNGGSDTFARIAGNRGNGDNLHVSNIEFYNSFSSRLVGEMRGITGAGGTQSNSGQLAFYTNDNGTYAERMRIISGGNVGIGCTPTSILNISSSVNNVVTDIESQFRIINTFSGGVGALGFSANGSDGQHGRAGIVSGKDSGSITGYMAFVTRVNSGSYAERMRITSGGNVGIGVTPGSTAGITELAVGGATSNPNFSGIRDGVNAFQLYSDSAGTLLYERRNLDLRFGTNNTLKMTIAANGSIGAPSGTNIYNASDLRLKRNVTTITNGLDKINALNPVKFNWIDGFEPSENEKDLLGFIAQEVQSVIPEAVEGFNSGNTINLNDVIIENPLRVNEKFIIPVLVKAIQEQQAQIEELKAMIAAK